MENLISFENAESLEKILFPMLNILDNKNIIKGITMVTENDKLYICFDKSGLSEINKTILFCISSVYSETLFYSNNNKSPSSDRLEYWGPDEDMAIKSEQKCSDKNFFVLELDINNKMIIMGTTIMLANILQMQDPIHLELYKKNGIIEDNIFKRHENYILSGSPDLNWISIKINLNKDNPLNDNPYAPNFRMTEINAPVICDNMFLMAVVGRTYNKCNEYFFDMELDNLKKVINEYFNKTNNNINLNQEIYFDETNKKLLLNK